MTKLCVFLTSWMSTWLGSAGVPTVLSKFIKAAWVSDDCPYCSILRGFLAGLGLALATRGGFLLIVGLGMVLVSVLLTRIEAAAKCGVRT